MTGSVKKTAMATFINWLTLAMSFFWRYMNRKCVKKDTLYIKNNTPIFKVY